MSNSTLSWFSNYLFNRSQYVKIDQQLSVPLTINKGVPQSSVLASTLFSIYINNIYQVICSQKTYIHIYADDPILYVVGSSYDEVLKQAQDSFNKIQEAFNDLNLVLNSTKTKVMWFGKKQQNNKDIITPDGAIIEVVSSYKYLRIWLDISLTFTTHITNQKKVKS